MIRKLSFLIPAAMVFLIYGCIKESYDMDKLSDRATLSPSLALPAFSGSVSLGDIIDPGDTVVFGEDKSVKLIFRKDSVINLEMEDIYDLSNMVAFNGSYEMGELKISDFQGTLGFTLDQITQSFSAILRNQFVALNDGANHPFPPFPATNLGEGAFTAFPNFQNAVFASGFLDISITNNLTAPLNSMTVSLYNAADHSSIGNALTIPAVQPGQTASARLDLTGRTVTNSVKAAVSLSGSPGNPVAVPISLLNSNISIKAMGTGLKVRSGRVILPQQAISTTETRDVISFNPGAGIELEKLKILTGNLSYHVSSTTPLSAAMNLTLPNAIRNGNAINELIVVNPVNQSDGLISFNNTVVDLNSDVAQPYNKVPFIYSLNVTSNNSIINFSSTDKVQLSLKLINPGIDYVKGYFGQQIETIEADPIDFDIDDILGKITGDFLVSSPSIKLNYSNSFAIPIQVSLEGEGRNGTESVSLGLAPFTIALPAAPASRDIASSFMINKSNSSLPELISMPPGEIILSGSAKMNPAGDPNHLRNNYLFGNSRFIGSLEVEVPMEFRLNNLQLTDTVDNFLKDDDNSFNAGDMQLLQLAIRVSNGFPLGISLKMLLYDSVTGTVKNTLDATDILKAAPVDGNGKVTGLSESNTSITFNNDFFNAVNKADKIIFRFTLNTSENGLRDVKIYSDYKISFNAAVIAKPEFDL